MVRFSFTSYLTPLMVLLTFGCIRIEAQVFDKPRPREVATFQFIPHDSSFQAHYFLSPFNAKNRPRNSKFKSTAPVILDKNGYVAAYLHAKKLVTFDFRYWPESQLYTCFAIDNHTVTYYVYDTAFTLIDSIQNTEDVMRDAHEFQILKNGNYVIGGQELDTMILTGPSVNWASSFIAPIVRGYVIQEFNDSHQLVFEWRSNDHFDPTDGYSNYRFNHQNFNYCHGNSIEEDDDGNFLVSFRNMNAISKISRTSGKEMWRLGGKSSTFFFIEGEDFSGQHDARRLDNGNISIYDNSFMGQRSISRASEYRIDLNRKTAELVWQFSDADSAFAKSLGNHEVSPNGIHLINFGRTERPPHKIVMVNHDKRLLSEIILSDSVINYRAHFSTEPIHLSRPIITWTKVDGGILLAAPRNHSKYDWSDGSSTSKIFVEKAGEYQVWVSQGEAMVGSYPLLISKSDKGLQVHRAQQR